MGGFPPLSHTGTLVVVVVGFQVGLVECGCAVGLFRWVVEKQNTDYLLGGAVARVNVSCRLW